ncbi:hypothetical protein FISHEDRAFT_73580 [Fistulina hepatica ATCC 64428]|uniref:Rheb small monomeric GTPase RhbA n=1 Tax=Fistulina hepatica ATCC 64428 TaxID=1128425 RepID=A0A0D7ADW7_9AGAR|nr:hypothetical protein FISHEDRAFT_73580 [Fistulina hepatica ATCC 64428]
MPASVDNAKKRKVAVLGARSVGKSCLIKKYIDDTFAESYFPTIETSHTKSVKYHGQDYSLTIVDTAGQDEFSPMNAQHAIGIHGYVLVYSIASRNSFDMIKIIYDKIVDYSGITDIPCVIVASKLDLQDSSRQIPVKDGEALAQECNGAFVETSSKQDINVAKVFDLCLAEMERRLAPNQTEPPAKSCFVM